MGNKRAKPVAVKLFLNGQPLKVNQGKDVKNSTIVVNQYALYEAVALPQLINGVLQITADSPGLELYTFTFGS